MYILIGCSLLLAVGFLSAFIWSVKSGQLDDDYTPSVRILFDDIEKKKDINPPLKKEPINEILTLQNTPNHAD
jgi:cbb3-type cytochrome oxidase maturation protein